MNSLGVVFLGLIAISSLVQAAFLIRLAIEGRRFSSRLDAIQDRFEKEVRPAFDNLNRITRNLAEVSDTAVLQARRVDGLLADTVEKIEETTGTLQRLVLRPLGPLVDVAAFFKGIRRGLTVYRQLSGMDSPERPFVRRSSEEDEHLFI
ncbi:MAG TPA: hypothetical protein VN083_06860 [Vicinamibacteria bacterium]|jgi:hypothetical protein|nr:hypothetical protein [Vicinamibacteria bacterium]